MVLPLKKNEEGNVLFKNQLIQGYMTSDVRAPLSDQ